MLTDKEIKSLINFKLFKDKFLFIPLGGCDFIGTNIYLYHFKEKWIAIDCGIGFSDTTTPGSKIMVPDLTILKKYNIKLSGLIITHAHEDHIGAICDSYKELNCPIFCTTFARHFLETDMLENNVKKKDITIIEVRPNKRKFQIESFEIEMIPLAHSIVEAHGILIKTSEGSVFHTGDWKFDTNLPNISEQMGVKRLEELGKNKEITTLICDSTNCMKEGPGNTEIELENSIFEILQNKKGLIVFSTFASNLYRIDIAYNVAKKLGRRLVLSGHSMRRIFAIAQQSGYFQDMEILDPNDAKKFPRNKLLVLATGCQGEVDASIAKLADGKHKFFKLQPQDTVMISSGTIPGNELDVANVINKLIMKNVDLITEKDYKIHSSGHPYRSDLKKMYSAIKPKSFIPMHGDWLMLSEHMKFAASQGIKKSIMPQNGIIIQISENELKKIGEIKPISLCLDGTRKIREDSKIYKERIKISQDGIIFCSVILDKKGFALCNPEFSSFGLFDQSNKDDQKILMELQRKLQNIIKPGFFSKKINLNEIQGTLAQFLKKEIHNLTGKLSQIEINVKII